MANEASWICFVMAWGGEIAGAPYDRMLFLMATAIFFRMWGKK